MPIDPDSRSCADCGAPFVFGDEERRFYADRGFKEPDRCLDCRARRRAERNADLIRAHESQTRDRWVEALGHYGGNSSGQRTETFRRNASYPATCAACGKETAVPFVPRHGRPVYCSSCYNSRRVNQGSRS
ncbi:MAG: CxxC-x17-CxxC domain-containing protein [Thermomicrobiales bacterium]